MDFNRIRREVVLKLADIIDKHRPQSLNELRTLLRRDVPVVGEFRPVASPSNKSPPRKSDTSPVAPAKESIKSLTKRSSEASETSTVATPAGHNDLLPRLICPFANLEETILRHSHVAALESALPYEYRGYDWELAFSTTTQGFNIDSFFSAASNHIATILVVSDVETKSVFGGFCPEQWSNRGDEYYGNGQSFLFSFSGDSFRDYHWARVNNFFMISNDDCIAMGQGQGGFGFYIDSDLKQGTTSPCSTYGNDVPLVQRESGDEGFDGTNQEFICRSIELWSFIPKTVHKRRASSLLSN
jgi:hypothetical protein